MTPNEFVKLYMQNCQYGNELSLMAVGIAEENGLVVVFGASDDLCEVRGAVDDEIDCFDGRKTIIAGAKVKINWCKNGYSWTYDTDIPHECFDVYENGEKYCRGIVFSISDVRLPAADVRPERHGRVKMGYQPKLILGRVKDTGYPIDSRELVFSLWDYDNYKSYHLSGWKNEDDEVVMQTIYQSEEEAGLCLYDSFEDFTRAWKSDEYEPQGSFCLSPDNVEMLEVIQAEKRLSDKCQKMGGKGGNKND